MINITFIQCLNASTANGVVSDVEAGNLWGVSMGTTSKAVSHSNYVLIQATQARTLELLDYVPDEEVFNIQSSLIDADSFSDADLDWKIWFLRGILGE